jgi:hypothetical protein
MLGGRPTTMIMVITNSEKQKNSVGPVGYKPLSLGVRSNRGNYRLSYVYSCVLILFASCTVTASDEQIKLVIVIKGCISLTVRESVISKLDAGRQYLRPCTLYDLRVSLIFLKDLLCCLISCSWHPQTPRTPLFICMSGARGLHDNIGISLQR